MEIDLCSRSRSDSWNVRWVRSSSETGVGCSDFFFFLKPNPLEIDMPSCLVAAHANLGLSRAPVGNLDIPLYAAPAVIFVFALESDGGRTRVVQIRSLFLARIIFFYFAENEKMHACVSVRAHGDLRRRNLLTTDVWLVFRYEAGIVVSLSCLVFFSRPWHNKISADKKELIWLSLLNVWLPLSTSPTCFRQYNIASMKQGPGGMKFLSLVAFLLSTFNVLHHNVEFTIRRQ